jgi:hypothetical protein
MMSVNFTVAWSLSLVFTRALDQLAAFERTANCLVGFLQQLATYVVWVHLPTSNTAFTCRSLFPSAFAFSDQAGVGLTVLLHDRSPTWLARFVVGVELGKWLCGKASLAALGCFHGLRTPINTGSFLDG